MSPCSDETGPCERDYARLLDPYLTCTVLRYYSVGHPKSTNFIKNNFILIFIRKDSIALSLRKEKPRDRGISEPPREKIVQTQITWENLGKWVFGRFCLPSWNNLGLTPANLSISSNFYLLSFLETVQ
jgi:hypothetical protein